MANLVYFEPITNNDIASHREQNTQNEICQQQLEVYSIRIRDIRGIKNTNIFGFTTGRSSDHVQSFIMCEYIPLVPDEFYVELVSDSSTVASLLLTAVEDIIKVRALPIRKLVLYCLGTEMLKRWYQSVGFTYGRTICTQPAIFCMMKYL